MRSPRRCARHFNPLPSYEGRRRDERSCLIPTKRFQSTPLIRGEIGLSRCCPLGVVISIHSPHTRGDIGQRRHHRHPLISIHSPHARGDCRWTDTGRTSLISIHSPLTRGDTVSRSIREIKRHFNPLPSHEGRQHKPPKIHPDLRQLTQQNHDTPLFGALQAPFCGAKPDIRGAKPTGKP